MLYTFVIYLLYKITATFILPVVKIIIQIISPIKQILLKIFEIIKDIIFYTKNSKKIKQKINLLLLENLKDELILLKTQIQYVSSKYNTVIIINPEILNNNVQIKRGFLTDDTAIHKYSYKISFFMNTCDTKRAVNILEDLTQRIKKANSFLGYEVKENEFEQNNNYIKIPVIFNGIAQHNINWLTDIKQKAKCLI